MEGVRNPADLSAVEADIAEIAVDIAALVVDVTALQADVTDIKAVTDGLPTLSETGGTVTTDGTEQNVYVNEAPAGVFRPMCVKLDCTNQTATETVVIRTYYRIAPAGAYVLQDTLTFVGAISPELVNIDLEPNRYGVRVTLELTAGTNREYTWEVCYKI